MTRARQERAFHEVKAWTDRPWRLGPGGSNLP
jgi:hypothetical protein